VTVTIAGTETPIEETSAAKPVVDALAYVQPTVTAAVEQSTLDKLRRPHDRRESAEWAVFCSKQPFARATVLPEFKELTHPYWLTIALEEPLASATPASFEIELSHWFPAPQATIRDWMLRYITRADPKPREPRAYRTFVELAEWLEMTQEETARLLGMGRTTPLSWRRAGHEPQPARARRLYQTHALVSTLRRRLGQDAMRRWLDAGDPSPLALIAQGDVTGADDLADELIFGTAPSRERLGAWVEEPADTDPSAAEPKQGPPPRVRRRPPRRRTP
jgi:hypothetical protein